MPQVWFDNPGGAGYSDYRGAIVFLFRPILLEDDTIGWVSRKFVAEAPETACGEAVSPPEPTPGKPLTTGPISGILTSDQLQEIVSSPRPETAASMTPPLNRAMGQAEINTPLRQAAFIAQVAHESLGFSRFTENLNYRAEGLLDVFGKYFTEAEAEDYAHQPEKIANRVYADRFGNGDEDSGDGWRYRGRGFIQITGKDNYRDAGKFLNLDLVGNPELAEGLEVGTMVAAWYWSSRELNSINDRGQFDTITKRINGGFNGLEERRAYYQKAKEILGA